MESFPNRAERRVVIETWRRRYNHERLHSSLGYRPLVEFRAEIENGRHDDPACGAGSSWSTFSRIQILSPDLNEGTGQRLASRLRISM